VKLKLDENLPAELVRDLQSAGHDVETVVQEGLTGATDPTILERATGEGRVLLTLDKGIADVRVYPPENFAGIVLFRPPSSGRSAVRTFVRQRLPALLQTPLHAHLLVVTEYSIRLR
jgi:predicted nuclease of predicted toxin-antitoxin system